MAKIGQRECYKFWRFASKLIIIYTSKFLFFQILIIIYSLILYEGP